MQTGVAIGDFVLALPMSYRFNENSKR